VRRAVRQLENDVDSSMRSTLLLGVEFGVRAAEKGWNLQRALHEAQMSMSVSIRKLEKSNGKGKSRGR